MILNIVILSFIYTTPNMFFF